VDEISLPGAVLAEIVVGSWRDFRQEIRMLVPITLHNNSIHIALLSVAC
jgi:hypothetical protein